MRVGSLFSGIGGIDLGLERAGMRVAWQCESDPYCRAVLRKHWPLVPCFDDVRTIHHGDAEPVDVIAGGFPCQPVSFAGRGLAQADERWLWPEFARVILLLRPRFVLVENVPGLLARGMGDVLGDLAASGYDAEWDCIPAAALGAPHRRDRVWIVAYPNGEGEHARPVDAEVGGSPQPVEDTDSGAVQPRRRRRGACEAGPGTSPVSDADCQGRAHAQRRSGSPARWRPIFGPDHAGRWENEWEPEPAVDRVADGVPHRMDRLRALGNAVVPQVAEWIGRRMMDAAA